MIDLLRSDLVPYYMQQRSLYLFCLAQAILYRPCEVQAYSHDRLWLYLIVAVVVNLVGG